MWSLIATVVGWFLSLITGRKTSDAERAGQATQQSSDLQATAKNVEEAKRAQDDVRSASDDRLDELRREWTRPGGDQR